MASPAHPRSDEDNVPSIFVLPQMSQRAHPNWTSQQRCANELSKQRLRGVALIGERKSRVGELSRLEAALATNRFPDERQSDYEESSIDDQEQRACLFPWKMVATDSAEGT